MGQTIPNYYLLFIGVDETQFGALTVEEINGLMTSGKALRYAVVTKGGNGIQTKWYGG